MLLAHCEGSTGWSCLCSTCWFRWRWAKSLSTAGCDKYPASRAGKRAACRGSVRRVLCRPVSLLQLARADQAVVGQVEFLDHGREKHVGRQAQDTVSDLREAGKYRRQGCWGNKTGVVVPWQKGPTLVHFLAVLGQELETVSCDKLSLKRSVPRNSFVQLRWIMCLSTSPVQKCARDSP